MVYLNPHLCMFLISERTGSVHLLHICLVQLRTTVIKSIKKMTCQYMVSGPHQLLIDKFTEVYSVQYIDDMISSTSNEQTTVHQIAMRILNAAASIWQEKSSVTLTFEQKHCLSWYDFAARRYNLLECLGREDNVHATFTTWNQHSSPRRMRDWERRNTWASSGQTRRQWTSKP